MSDDWKKRVESRLDQLGGDDRERRAFLDVNVNSVAQVIQGLGPDDTNPRDGAGARIVFNMSCKHVPTFCAQSRAGDPRPYKNAYDLGTPSADRQRVDGAIEQATRLEGKEVYFAAVETSGTGIRFYGDMCLVLKLPDPSDPTAVNWSEIQVLDRNSYDLIREPVRSHVRTGVTLGISFESAASDVLWAWKGKWGKDLANIAAIKVMPSLPRSERRWTTGQIAGQVLDDEDYIEVLYPRSFRASDLYEVRIGAADAAAESDIADREANGEAPSMHELEWRQQRREAKRALAKAGIPIRVVTTTGRIKGA